MIRAAGKTLKKQVKKGIKKAKKRSKIFFEKGSKKAILGQSA